MHDFVDAHVRSAIPPLLDELVPTLVRREVVAALPTEDDESPPGTALKGPNSSAVADRLATTFSAEAVVNAVAVFHSTAPVSTFTHAEPIGAVPGIGTMAPHREGKPTLFPSLYGATGWPIENGPPALADTSSPRGTENRLERLEPEKQEPYRSRKRSALVAQGYNSEGTENPSEDEDPRSRHRAMPNSRDGRYAQYRDARGSRYPSDDYDTESDGPRRSDRIDRSARDRLRFQREDFDQGSLSRPDGEGDRRRKGKDRCRRGKGRRPNLRRDPKRLPMIRLLNGLFTRAVDHRTYRLENHRARYDTSTGGRILPFRTKLYVQMRTHTIGGQDPIAVLGFLARLNMSCDHSGVGEGAPVCVFPVYLTGQAHSLLQSRLNGNPMAVDAEQRDLLETYSEIVEFLLRTDSTDEVILEAVGDVTAFRQSSKMTEVMYSNHLLGQTATPRNRLLRSVLKVPFC